MPRPPFDHFRFVAPLYERLFDGYTPDAGLVEPLALPIEGWLLDAGGGTGRVSQNLRMQTGGVVVADASLGMLRQVGKKDSLRAANALAEHLPFADGRFERILIVDAFHHFHRYGDAARELWRVLMPGGRLVLHEPNIARWPVKLIALGETLLLMRSRFFRAEALEALFTALPGARVTVNTQDDPYAILLVAEKPR